MSCLYEYFKVEQITMKLNFPYSIMVSHRHHVCNC